MKLVPRSGRFPATCPPNLSLLTPCCLLLTAYCLPLTAHAFPVSRLSNRPPAQHFLPPQKDSGEHGPKEKTSDVSRVCYPSTCLDVRYGAEVDQLHQEPDSDQEHSGDVCDSNEYEDDEKRANLILRVRDKKRPHHAGNGPARAEVGDRGAGVNCDLSEGGSETGKQVKDQIAIGTKQIFDLRSEGPQEDHVAQNVRPPTMHEHRGEDGDHVLTGRNLGRDERPFGNERLPAENLHHKDHNIGQDDRGRDYRKAGRPARHIGEGDYAHIASLLGVLLTSHFLPLTSQAFPSSVSPLP